MNDNALAMLLTVSFVAAAAPVLHHSARAVTDPDWETRYQLAALDPAALDVSSFTPAALCRRNPAPVSTYLGVVTETLSRFDRPMTAFDDGCQSTDSSQRQKKGRTLRPGQTGGSVLR